MVEMGEDCDGALAPTCTTAGCDSDCNAIVIAPGCDNGCVEAGETCGEPGLAACAAGSACVGCSCVVTCGNGVVDAGETCGEPGLSCRPSETCTNCGCVPNCGNGRLDPGEGCDPPAPPSCTSSSFCTDACQVMARPRMCGNGCLDIGETCGEPGAMGCSGGETCSTSTCSCLAACGNGLIDPGETCDPLGPVFPGGYVCPPGSTGAISCPSDTCEADFTTCDCGRTTYTVRETLGDNPNVSDWYAWRATPGTVLTIQMDTVAGGGFDPLLYICPDRLLSDCYFVADDIFTCTNGTGSCGFSCPRLSNITLPADADGIYWIFATNFWCNNCQTSPATYDLSITASSGNFCAPILAGEDVTDRCVSSGGGDET
jgi:hypothetical protein